MSLLNPEMSEASPNDLFLRAKAWQVAINRKPQEDLLMPGKQEMNGTETLKISFKLSW